MRKSKIANLFDWKSFEAAQAKLAENPKDKAATKTFAAEQKKLKAFKTSVTKDLKLGLAELKAPLVKGETKATIPYYLYLDYFGKEAKGESLLILGTQPNIKKGFVAAAKTGDKVNISFGIAQLDNNGILQFIPTKNGMQVKPKPVVDSLKKAPISKSEPGFWSKRKVSNVIIAPEKEEQQSQQAPSSTDQFIGDESKVDEKVSYTEKGTGSEIYDQFKSFVNRDYSQSKGTRNAEYYQAALRQVDEWVKALQDEFKTKRDPSLKKRYSTMGKNMLAFKKQLQKEIKADKAQLVNEDASLSTIKNSFDQTLSDYEKAKDDYGRSIVEAKLRRILSELEQKINGDSNQQEAIALKTSLEKALSTALKSTKENPKAKKEADDLLVEMEALFQAFSSSN
ncbi:hypothetical protein [Aureispira anguillae]|uniref:Uncharacterized protein n=1 Tax=Aureispira anguillae TaxID=2864201 RepID=A0A915VMM0_9BACT|nr:hypothetical protein [Aureispira anguillae]BDS09715.1 hypothetical protein AsAng_0004200 [Aureispira anguillae]